MSSRYLARLAAVTSALALIAVSAPAVAADFETRRCTNIGNALDAPAEGTWGHAIEQRYFEAIGKTTIDTVRIPVRWDTRSLDAAPYTIDPAFFSRVDEVIGWAMAEGLIVILNIHHYDALYDDPAGQRAKFTALWTQIAEHYKDYPGTLYFEVLNEPRNELSGALMQEVLLDGLARIRKTNPERTVIIGGDQWNSLRGLPSIPATPDDANIVHTFHYYDPHTFTHQKAPWAGGSPDDDVDWGSEAERARVVADAEQAASHAAATGYPVLLGEYGVNGDADLDRRVRWTGFVTATMQDHGIATCNWAFTDTFPVWDYDSGTWLPGMEDALGITDKPAAD